MTSSSCFTPFKHSIEHIPLPERFTFPFFYQPHPLCELAASELQQHLQTQQDWQHNFGIEGDTEDAIGKMFGVLIVKDQQGEIGYLSAFSGKMADQNLLPGFVPPVFDMLSEDSFFLPEQKEINAINHQIEELENNESILNAVEVLSRTQKEAEQSIAEHRKAMTENRKKRKALRNTPDPEISKEAHSELIQKLNQQSVIEKLQLRDLKLHWEQETEKAQTTLEEQVQPLNALKEERKVRSNKLQKRLFENYRFLNKAGQEKDLTDIFKDTTAVVPPAGAGECAAPKLLQYAFSHNLTPVAMAEFWWGISPKSEIRRHKNFYPSCKGKCEPILGHMLEGIEMDENPLLKNPAEGKELEIIYQDEHMVVVNKPADFLSVPGKNIEDSVYSRIKKMYPKATGTLVIHRLDMSTSGLIVLALSARAQKQLHKQFITRQAQKRYVALIEGVPECDSGEISLPMRGDPDDRPRQLVCFQHGKPAETHWEKVEVKNGRCKLYLYPRTGRTHQLRVHCAHQDGLNMPIVGDDLYGQNDQRLFLHAESLTLEHPITKALMTFKATEPF